MRKDVIILIISVLFVSFLSFIVKFFGSNDIIPWGKEYSDVWFFRWFAFDPNFPYEKKIIEYPVIIGIFIQIMGLIGKDALGYYISSSVFLISFALLTSYFLYKILVLYGFNKKNLYYFWVFAPSFFLFVIYNWDIITVFFSVLALYFFKKNMDKSASLALSFGFATKFYPILFLMPMILKRGMKKRIKMLLVFFVSFFIVNSYFIVNNFEGWLKIYTYHSGRIPNSDSIWGVISVLFPRINLDFINLFTLIAFSVLYVLVIWKGRKGSIINLWFISLLLFMILNKIFSPQYIIWLLMFFVLNRNFSKTIFYSLEISNAIVLFSILNWVMLKETIFINISYIAVLIRHVILVCLLFFYPYFSQKLLSRGSTRFKCYHQRS